MSSRVLITGGTGFIGSRLALRCREAGDPVRVLGRRRTPVEEERASELEEQGIEVCDGSVTDAAAVAEALRGVEVVHHLAAAQHEANVPDDYFREINVDGTRRVFEAAEQAGVSRVVHGSTIGVYGWQPGTVSDEEAPLEPDNIYGVTKLAGEEVVRSFAGRVPFVIVRISETYGPGDRRLLKLFRGARRGLCLQIGPARNLHHLVFVDDLLEGLVLASRAEAALGQTLVLAGPEPVTSRQILEAVAREVGGRRGPLRLPLAPLLGVAALLEAALRPLGLQPPLHRRRMDFFRKSFAFSLEEPRQRLGYAPRVGLAEGIAATARWYRQEDLL